MHLESLDAGPFKLVSVQKCLTAHCCLPHLAQEAGCEVHAAGKDPFDCQAALSNFFRAPYQEFMFHGIYGIHGIRDAHGMVLIICN